MKKKQIILIIAILLLTNCKTENETNNILTPSYMFEVFEQNYNCSKTDLIDINIDGDNVYYDYTGNLNLCGFSEGNSDNVFCVGCESHYANIRFPSDNYNSYFNNLPINLGMTWSFSNSGSVINKINFKGLDVFISGPNELVKNLKIGKYKIPNDITKKGIKLSFRWEVKTVDFETGYTLDIDKNQPYEISINCIDKSDPDVVRLSGYFEGVFIGKDVFNNGSNNIIYQIPVSGFFSYLITLK